MTESKKIKTEPEKNERDRLKKDRDEREREGITFRSWDLRVGREGSSVVLPKKESVKQVKENS